MSKIAIVGPPAVYYKKVSNFPSPAGISLTKLSLAGIKLFLALVSGIPAGDRKVDNLFLQCMILNGIPFLSPVTEYY
jgi:hypothetical protein